MLAANIANLPFIWWDPKCILMPKNFKLLKNILDPIRPEPVLGKSYARHCSPAYLPDPLFQIIPSAQGLRKPKIVKSFENKLDPIRPEPVLGQSYARHCSPAYLPGPLFQIIPSAQERASLRSLIC